MMSAQATTHHHHGPISLLADAIAWLRRADTRRHVEAAYTALDRVDTTLDRLDEAGHLVAPHLEHHRD